MSLYIELDASNCFFSNPTVCMYPCHDTIPMILETHVEVYNFPCFSRSVLTRNVRNQCLLYIYYSLLGVWEKEGRGEDMGQQCDPCLG